MTHVSVYEIHPTQEHMVLTPDGGVIECKHEAAAKRVRDELNKLLGAEGRLLNENNLLYKKLDALRMRMHNEGIGTTI